MTSSTTTAYTAYANPRYSDDNTRTRRDLLRMASSLACASVTLPARADSAFSKPSGDESSARHGQNETMVVNLERVTWG